MNVSCLQETLNKGLGIVGRAVATRTTLPITQNVLISTDQGRLKLTATNLEIAISTWIGATVEEEGDITIPARLLSEFVSSLQNEKVDMVTTTQPQAMTLSCARYEARIIGTDAGEFPPIPTGDDDFLEIYLGNLLLLTIVTEDRGFGEYIQQWSDALTLIILFHLGAENQPLLPEKK